MKVYVLRIYDYDYYEFEALEAISRTKQKLVDYCETLNNESWRTKSVPVVFTEAGHEKLFDTGHYYISHEELI